MDSPSHISRVQTVVSISPAQDTQIEYESDLTRLERENRELRRELEKVVMVLEEERVGDEKYEEIAGEMARLQHTLHKVTSASAFFMAVNI